MALPRHAIAIAGARWIDLLSRSDEEMAWTIISSRRDYADLATHQYREARDWLLGIGALLDTESGVQLSPELREATHDLALLRVFELAVLASPPPWLEALNSEAIDEVDMPFGVEEFCNALGVQPLRAARAIHGIVSKVDPRRNEEIGSAGEEALFEALDEILPGNVTHVSLVSDHFGYDIAVDAIGVEWHIEVKTTTRKGRLMVYVTRHELEVAMRDPGWIMVVVGMDPNLQMLAIGTIRGSRLIKRRPRDFDGGSKWQVVGLEIRHDELERGLPFIGAGLLATAPTILRTGTLGAETAPDWIEVEMVNPPARVIDLGL